MPAATIPPKETGPTLVSSCATTVVTMLAAAIR